MRAFARKLLVISIIAVSGAFWSSIPADAMRVTEKDVTLYVVNHSDSVNLYVDSAPEWWTKGEFFPHGAILRRNAKSINPFSIVNISRANEPPSFAYFHLGNSKDDKQYSFRIADYCTRTQQWKTDIYRYYWNLDGVGGKWGERIEIADNQVDYIQCDRFLVILREGWGVGDQTYARMIEVFENPLYKDNGMEIEELSDTQASIDLFEKNRDYQEIAINP